MEDLVSAFGAVVRRERLRQGLSQEKLAERAGLHTNFVSLLERGKSASALDTIVAVATALGRRPSQLVRAAEQASHFGGDRKLATRTDKSAG